MTEKELVLLAIEAMKTAYAPYSGFTVGAALLTADERCYTGCNIENASYSATVCAERTALFKAVSDGARTFAMLAVAGGKSGHIDSAFPPCGVCRQVLAEFCPPDMPILVARDKGKYDRYTLAQLLPAAFGSEHLR